jgi:hypothetical protein
MARKQLFFAKEVENEETGAIETVTIEVHNDVQADALKNEGFVEVDAKGKKVTEK